MNQNQPSRLHWHADGRAPILGYGGEFPLVKETDPVQPEEFWTGFVNVFDLSKPEDLASYNRIVDSVCKGVGFIGDQQVVFSEKNNNFMVFVRWAQRFYANPRAVFAKANLNAAGQIEFPR